MLVWAGAYVRIVHGQDFVVYIFIYHDYYLPIVFFCLILLLFLACPFSPTFLMKVLPYFLLRDRLLFFFNDFC